MSHKNLAMVGFGDLGQRVCRRLRAPWRALGLRRNAGAVPAGVRGIAVDFARAQTLNVLEALAPEGLLVTLSPAQRTQAGYRAGFTGAIEAIVKGLGRHRPEHAYFVSSTRVYAETEGGWVDEDSPLAENDPLARAIIDAERCFLDALPNSLVLRAGGLYGHGPGPLLAALDAGRLSPRQPPRYSNRIHREDVAAFIVHALAQPPSRRVINLVDGHSVSIQEIEAWLCARLRRPYDPPEFAAGPVRSHKRVRNTRLRETGFRFTYADFRSGYGELLRRSQRVNRT